MQCRGKAAASNWADEVLNVVEADERVNPALNYRAISQAHTLETRQHYLQRIKSLEADVAAREQLPYVEACSRAGPGCQNDRKAQTLRRLLRRTFTPP